MQKSGFKFFNAPAAPVLPRSGPPALRTGLVARVKQRLFSPAAPGASAAAAALVPATVKGRMTFQASIAELLLVNRLKARSQKDQAARMLERASAIIFVTCKSWFAGTGASPSRHDTRW